MPKKVKVKFQDQEHIVSAISKNDTKVENLH